MISNEMINQFSEIIKNKLNPIKIILFGSFALGNQNLNSDLDILVCKYSPLKRKILHER
jgi:predicted nucleotidyltransferase